MLKIKIQKNNYMNKIKITFFLVILLIISDEVLSQGYFQQRVNYKIYAELDTLTGSLISNIEIDYQNNSDSVLEVIYIHLWANAYKKRSTDLAQQMAHNGEKNLFFGVKKMGGYIDSLDFKVNGQTVRWEYVDNKIDIAILYLEKPLGKNEQLLITTPFYLKIPSGDISRLGVDNQNYQITQWYPKPAVYDMTGWHYFPYLQYGEFYSEFGNYEVTLKVPTNFVVAATGELKTESEVKWINNFANSYKTGEKQTHTVLEKTKTIKYFAENVHDFAWFASADYLVEKNQVVLPNSKDTVNTWTMYYSSSNSMWSGSTEYVNDAIYFYSSKVGDYPYENCTAVEGALKAGGGMEYPMITVISAGDDKFTLETVIMHEVGHNWFYGILGFNERQYPFLDEGLNSFYETRYISDKYPNTLFTTFLGISSDKNNSLQLENKPYYLSDYLMYVSFDALGYDMPINLPSSEYTKISYYSAVYKKAAAAFMYLMSYISEEKFDNIMRDFYEKWKFKHPTPSDLKLHIEKSVGEDMSWFFDGVLNSSQKLDFKINKVRKNEITIKNCSKIAAPISVSGIVNKEEKITTWTAPFKNTIKVNLSDEHKYDCYALDYKYQTLDFFKNNNYWYVDNIFKRYDRFKIQFASSLNLSSKWQVNIMPLLGWNYYNKLMLGGYLSNFTIPNKDFQYRLMPFYSFTTKNLNGNYALSYKILRSRKLDIFIKTQGKTYAYNENQNTALFEITDLPGDKISNYVMLKSELDINLKYVKNYHSRENHFILKHYFLNEKENIFQFDYKYIKRSKLKPLDINISARLYDEQSLYFSFQSNFYFPYTSGKGIDLRLFASYINGGISNSYYVGLSNMSGLEDYTYENTFLARSEDVKTREYFLLARQVIINDGGFVLYTPFGTQSEWVAAINIKIGIPKMFVTPYINLGTYQNAGNQVYHFNYQTNNFVIASKTLAYETGFAVVVLKNVFEIYFPFVTSRDIYLYNNEITHRYTQRIKFLLNLNSDNIFEYLKKINLF